VGYQKLWNEVVSSQRQRTRKLAARLTVSGYVTGRLYLQSIYLRMIPTPLALSIDSTLAGPPSSLPIDTIHWIRPWKESLVKVGSGRREGRLTDPKKLTLCEVEYCESKKIGWGRNTYSSGRC